MQSIATELQLATCSKDTMRIPKNAGRPANDSAGETTACTNVALGRGLKKGLKMLWKAKQTG